MIVYITEQVATVVEVTYEVNVTAEVYNDGEVETTDRDDWTEIHRETIRRNAEIINVEEMDDRPYKVGVNGVTGYVASFVTTEEASRYIEETFHSDAVAAGHFYIDGPEQ